MSSTEVSMTLPGGNVFAPTSAPVAASATDLNALRPGVRARVVAVHGTDAVARRLIEMGVVPGAPIYVVKAAPLGDPIQVQVRGYSLALRRAEARTISVVPGDR